MALAGSEFVDWRTTLIDPSHGRRLTGIVTAVLGAGTIVAGGQLAGLASWDAGSASVIVAPGNAVESGTSSTDTVSGDNPITIHELMTGQVDPERFNRFWQAEVDRIATSPCVAGATNAGQMRVVVGATPPPDNTTLRDWAPAIEEAHRQHAELCAGG